LLALLLRVKK